MNPILMYFLELGHRHCHQLHGGLKKAQNIQNTLSCPAGKQAKCVTDFYRVFWAVFPSGSRPKAEDFWLEKLVCIQT